MAKIKKATKPSQRDKEIKAKRTGYRFKTEGNPKLHKKDGSLNKKGEELYYKDPTADQIKEYKKKNNKYSDDLYQVYHERRANRKHSDDNLKTKYGKGGGVNTGRSWHLDRQKSNKSESWEKPMSKRKQRYDNGGGVGRIKVGTFDETQLKNKEDKKAIEKAQKETGLKYIDSKIIKKGGKMFMEVYLIPTDEYLKSSKFDKGGDVKQNKPQSKSYSKEADKLEKAKPVGMRYTDKLAKKLGKRVREEPTKKDVEKYLGKGVYDEKRKDKSDASISKKFEDGGKVFDDSKGSELKVGDSVVLTNVSDLDVEGGKLFVGKKLIVNKLIDLESNYISFKDEKGEVFEFYGYHVDKSISKKFEDGGETEKNIELSIDEMKNSLGREPKYPYDFIAGKKYVKCFLRPYYKLVD